MAKNVFRVSRAITLHPAGVNVPSMAKCEYIGTFGLKHKEQGSRQY